MWEGLVSVSWMDPNARVKGSGGSLSVKKTHSINYYTGHYGTLPLPYPPYLAKLLTYSRRWADIFWWWCSVEMKTSVRTCCGRARKKVWGQVCASAFETLTSVNMNVRLARSPVSSRVAVVDSHDPEDNVTLGCMFTTTATDWNCVEGKKFSHYKSVVVKTFTIHSIRQKFGHRF